MGKFYEINTDQSAEIVSEIIGDALINGINIGKRYECNYLNSPNKFKVNVYKRDVYVDNFDCTITRNNSGARVLIRLIDRDTYALYMFTLAFVLSMIGISMYRFNNLTGEPVIPLAVAAVLSLAGVLKFIRPWFIRETFLREIMRAIGTNEYHVVYRIRLIRKEFETRIGFKFNK